MILRNSIIRIGFNFAWNSDLAQFGDAFQRQLGHSCRALCSVYMNKLSQPNLTIIRVWSDKVVGPHHSRNVSLPGYLGSCILVCATLFSKIGVTWPPLGWGNLNIHFWITNWAFMKKKSGWGRFPFTIKNEVVFLFENCYAGWPVGYVILWLTHPS